MFKICPTYLIEIVDNFRVGNFFRLRCRVGCQPDSIYRVKGIRIKVKGISTISIVLL